MQIGNYQLTEEESTTGLKPSSVWQAPVFVFESNAVSIPSSNFKRQKTYSGLHLTSKWSEASPPVVPPVVAPVVPPVVPPVVAPSASRASAEWTERFAPKTSSGIVAQVQQKKRLLQWLKQRKSGHFDTTLPMATLLSGPPGCGKTLAAELCCREAGLTPTHFDASFSFEWEPLREKIISIVFRKALNAKGTALILDNFDGIDISFIAKLSALLQDHKVPFAWPVIIICNENRFLRKLTALHLKFYALPEWGLSKIALATRKVSSHAVPTLVKKANGDARKMLIDLQFSALSKSLYAQPADKTYCIFQQARDLLGGKASTSERIVKDLALENWLQGRQSDMHDVAEMAEQFSAMDHLSIPLDVSIAAHSMLMKFKPTTTSLQLDFPRLDDIVYKRGVALDQVVARAAS